MDQAPLRFPLQAAEKILVAGRKLGLVMGIIQLEMEFEGNLDPERLRRSLELLLLQHPILACRLGEQSGKHFWQWSKPEGPLLILAQSPEAFDKFRTSLADPAQGPQISACLWQRPSGDALLLKVMHEASDAGGVKEIGMDLAGIYTRLETEPDYQPSPNLQGSRSGWQVLQYLPRHKWPGIVFDFLQDLWANFVPRDSVTLPLPLDPGSPVTYVLRHLPAERVSSLAEYGRSRNATLNDMVMAAFYRALAKQGKGDRTAALRLQTTVDLRRYLPEERAEEICNLSAMAYPFLGKELGNDFEQTLARVATITRRLKQNWIGMPMFLPAYALLSLLPQKTLMKLLGAALTQGLKQGKVKSPPFLTNMGPISKDRLWFGTLTPVRAWLLPPICYPPILFSGLSGYSGSLTLSSGLPLSSRPLAETFFDELLSQLPQFGVGSSHYT